MLYSYYLKSQRCEADITIIPAHKDEVDTIIIPTGEVTEAQGG